MPQTARTGIVAKRRAESQQNSSPKPKTGKSDITQLTAKIVAEENKAREQCSGNRRARIPGGGEERHPGASRPLPRSSQRKCIALILQKLGNDALHGGFSRLR